MTSVFAGQPIKTRPFPSKTRVIWVPGIYIYILYIYIYIFVYIYIYWDATLVTAAHHEVPCLFELIELIDLNLNLQLPPFTGRGNKHPKL